MPSHPEIYTVTLAVANREYPFDIPGGASKITVKLRNENMAWRFAYRQGETVGTRYIYVPAGWVYWEDHVQWYPKGLRIYLNCPTNANQVAEILVWP